MSIYVVLIYILCFIVKVKNLFGFVVDIKVLNNRYFRKLKFLFVGVNLVYVYIVVL